MGKLISVLFFVVGVSSVAHAQAWYGEQAYLFCNEDVRRAVSMGMVESGYQHYITHGRFEGRITDGRCSANDAPRWFDEHGYVRCNADVAHAIRRGDFRSGWHHYRAHGQYENRAPGCYR
ncbi:MAG: hypothetical protein AB7G93_06285 [Bdellovibrionales bacterium]